MPSQAELGKEGLLELCYAFPSGAWEGGFIRTMLYLPKRSLGRRILKIKKNIL